MKILVLGSAAGGGFPQWNCNCHNCAGVRAGDPRFRARTQSSIAISADGVHWALINASPDILAQLKQHPELQPARMLRDSGISAVILVDAQIDHTTGLFMLRERASQLPVWCTEPVHQDLTTGNPVFGVLQHFCGVDWHPLRADPPTPFSLPELPDLLRAGDLLVFNDTRVLPARLYGRKATGGAVEILIERLTGRSSSSGCEISAPAEERSAIISRSFSWYGPEFAIRPKLCLYFAVETISMVRVIFLVFRTDFRRFSRTFALATSGYLRSDSG